MNKLSIFAFNDNMVRIHKDENGDPWFVAKDVCRILDIQNSRDAISGLDDDEKITVGNPDGNPRAGVPHQMVLVSESGLYALVFRSRKPQARAFSKWVRSEVLPSIRKTGSYALPGLPQPVLADSLGELPPDVMGISPRKRERYFDLALQAARLAGQGDPTSLRQTFIALCRGLSGSLPSVAKIVDPDREVHEFARQCCEYGKFVCRTADLFDAYNDWCRETGMAPALTLKMAAFARAFGRLPEIYIRRKRPFLIFEGIRLREGWLEGLRQEVRALEAAHA